MGTDFYVFMVISVVGTRTHTNTHSHKGNMIIIDGFIDYYKYDEVKETIVFFYKA